MFGSAHSLAGTPAIVLPSSAFSKVAIPMVSSVTPVLSPGDLSHSCAMLVTPGLQTASQSLARVPGQHGLARDGGLAQSFLSPCSVHFIAGVGEKQNIQPEKVSWKKLHP